MMPDSIHALLFVMCILGSCLAWGHDRALRQAELADEPEDDQDLDAREDEWREDQAIERQSRLA